MYMCVFPSQVLVLTNNFVPLNSASVSVEYNQILQYFLGNREEDYRFLELPIQIWCDVVLEKLIEQTEESSLSGQTHICARYVQIITPKMMVPNRSYSY